MGRHGRCLCLHLYVFQEFINGLGSEPGVFFGKGLQTFHNLWTHRCIALAKCAITVPPCAGRLPGLCRCARPGTQLLDQRVLLLQDILANTLLEGLGFFSLL